MMSSSSRSSSSSDMQPLSIVKVYSRVLSPDVEYKTLSISYDTTALEVIQKILSRHKDPKTQLVLDPKLFYLSECYLVDLFL